MKRVVDAGTDFPYNCLQPSNVRPYVYVAFAYLWGLSGVIFAPGVTAMEGEELSYDTIICWTWKSQLDTLGIP